MIGGLLTIDPEKRFSWNDFFEHSFITDEIDNDRDSEIDRLTTSEITKIRNKSDEVVDKLLKDDQSTYTQNIEENKEKPSSHQIYSVESDDFELKPSSTDLKFYDSTASKEDEKDSYVKERKIPNKSKQSLEVVKEASHKTNEEDLEEENKNQLLNMADEGRKNNVERRDDFEITIEEDLDPLLKQDLDKI